MKGGKVEGDSLQHSLHVHDYTAPSVPSLYPPLGEISESRLLSTEYEKETGQLGRTLDTRRSEQIDSPN